MIGRRALPIPLVDRRLRLPSMGYNRQVPWAEGLTSLPPVGTTVTSGAVDTKGSWAEMDASTEDDIYELEVTLATTTAVNATNTSTLLDIGIGAGGAEQIVVADLQIGHMPLQLAYWTIPIFIPAGTRLACRTQSAQAAKAINILLRGRSARVPGQTPARYCLTYGVVTASSRGTNIAIPGSLNTKGAWTELTAATAERLSGLIICTGSGSNNMAAQQILLDIGVGGAGSEQVIIPDLLSIYNTSEQLFPYGLPRIQGIDLPAGVRLAARTARSSLTGNHNCHLIGIPWR